MEVFVLFEVTCISSVLLFFRLGMLAVAQDFMLFINNITA